MVPKGGGFGLPKGRGFGLPKGRGFGLPKGRGFGRPRRDEASVAPFGGFGRALKNA
jgi:hypothetical protein